VGKVIMTSVNIQQKGHWRARRDRTWHSHTDKLECDTLKNLDLLFVMCLACMLCVL